MATGILTVAANVSGEPEGARSFGPLSVPTITSVTMDETIALTMGNNTITIPTGTTSVIIVGPNGVNPKPNPVSSVTLTLKGVSGDTGIAISAQNPVVLEWDLVVLPPSSIVINASSACNIYVWMQ